MCSCVKPDTAGRCYDTTFALNAFIPSFISISIGIGVGISSGGGGGGGDGADLSHDNSWRRDAMSAVFQRAVRVPAS
ncbi:unnamed protein product [Merluccius merluccius]